MIKFTTVDVIASPVPPLEVVEKPVLTDTSALVEAPADYWTPKSMTCKQREQVFDKMQKDVMNVFKVSRINCGFQLCRSFRREESVSNVEIMAVSLDGHSYGRAKIPESLPVILKELGVEHPSKHRKFPHYTSFMYDGVEVRLYHLSELKKGYTDANMVNFMYGYNNIKDLFDILLAKYGFVQDDSLTVKYVRKEEGKENEEYVIGQGEVAFRLLGFSYKGYSNIVYSGRYKDVADVVRQLLESKFIDIESFYVTPEKEYIGPADYFNSPVFKEAVEYLQKPELSYELSTMLPETIGKQQMKYFESANPNGYNMLIKKLETEIASNILNSKYNDYIVQEITGYKEGDTRIKMFKEAFEQRISLKQDFEFFVMSSSGDTIKQRLIEYHQQLSV